MKDDIQLELMPSPGTRAKYHDRTETMHFKLTNLDEPGVRRMLVSLGWTPPDVEPTSRIDFVPVYIPGGHETLAAWLMSPPSDDLAHQARQLVEQAAAMGCVLTIEQVPRKPLAMGNYETRVSVRPMRGQS